MIWGSLTGVMAMAGMVGNHYEKFIELRQRCVFMVGVFESVNGRDWDREFFPAFLLVFLLVKITFLRYLHILALNCWGFDRNHGLAGL